MASTTTPLSDMQVRNAKPKDKTYRLFDGGGLYVEVAPTGSRIWRVKFVQANGKESRLTFGPYPEISLQDAREKRLETRRLMLQGVDPAKHRDASRRLVADRLANTFEKIAREWYANKVPTWSERTAKNMIQRLDADIFPAHGRMPIPEVVIRLGRGASPLTYRRCILASRFLQILGIY